MGSTFLEGTLDKYLRSKRKPTCCPTNAPTKAGVPSKPRANHGFATKGAGEAEQQGKRTTTRADKSSEPIHMRRILKNDKPSETVAGNPSRNSEMIHITSAPSVTELLSVLAKCRLYTTMYLPRKK